MMILADSCIWIDHLRKRNGELVTRLGQLQILTHELIIGELATGNLPKRKLFLEDLGLLPMAPKIGSDELLHFIEREKLYGRGIGYNDVHLLAATKIASARLWTFDKRLHSLAKQYSCAFH